jgi:hypothetical protein
LCPWQSVVNAGTLIFEGSPNPIAKVFVVMLPEKVELGDRFRFRVLQRQSGRKTVIGGSTYEVQILAPYHRETTGDSVAQERRGRKTHMEDNIEVHV